MRLIGGTPDAQWHHDTLDANLRPEDEIPSLGGAVGVMRHWDGAERLDEGLGHTQQERGPPLD